MLYAVSYLGKLGNVAEIDLFSKVVQRSLTVIYMRTTINTCGVLEHLNKPRPLGRSGNPTNLLLLNKTYFRFNNDNNKLGIDVLIITEIFTDSYLLYTYIYIF